MIPKSIMTFLFKKEIEKEDIENDDIDNAILETIDSYNNVNITIPGAELRRLEALVERLKVIITSKGKARHNEIYSEHNRERFVTLLDIYGYHFKCDIMDYNYKTEYIRKTVK